MARLGRSQPIPATIRGRLRYSRVGLNLAPFEIPTEWPPISVVTPNVNLNLAAFEIPTEWPTLSLTRERRLTLAAFEIPTEWPPISVVLPVQPGDAMTGNDGEIEWNGTVWGGGQNLYRITEFDGWEDLPGIDSGNVERPSRHGSYSGRKYAQERIVTATIQVHDDSPTFVQSYGALRAATAVGEDDTEYPLVITLRGETLLAHGSITGRIVPTRLVGVGIVPVTVRWTCSDPRRYSLDLQGATVPVNTPTGLSNQGNTATHPLIRLEGPLTHPTLTNSSLDRALEFNLTVPAGKVLEIDTDNATVTLDGVSKMSTLTGSSVPVGDFVLAGGSNTIQYTVTADGSNGCDVLWRHAYL
ncbi:hypothetical protein [Nonomuraea sp. NPDC049141]|uniref:phage distal tail protein n=1 Tax=Nonomuraea sp. NPDC049141 TaxID=3155500 RepID=UPI00340DDF41